MRPAHGSAAFSFLEVMAAAGLVAVFLVGAFTANARGMYMIRCAKETNGASKVLQQRMEQLRSCSWTEVTDAATLKDVYTPAPDAGDSCRQLSETLTIAPWPALVGPNTITITRAVDGTTTIASDNDALVDGPAVLVTARVTWTGTGNRTRSRETATVIANGGLGR